MTSSRLTALSPPVGLFLSVNCIPPDSQNVNISLALRRPCANHLPDLLGRNGLPHLVLLSPTSQPLQQAHHPPNRPPRRRSHVLLAHPPRTHRSCPRELPQDPLP